MDPLWRHIYEKMMKYAKNWQNTPFLPFETIFTKFLAHESISWLQIPKEHCLGLRLRKKNHGVNKLEKSLRSFKNFLKEKNSDFFSNVLNFWQFEAFTKDRIPPKILFISPKSYFRSLKGFQLILGIKIFIGPIDQIFLKIIIFHTS